LPQIEGATGRFLLQQMVAVAELEAGMISSRTKAALAAAKRRGKKLGGRRYNSKGEVAHGSANALAAATRVREERSAQRASDLAPTIKALQAAGATSLRAIAAGLNERHIPTARGQGEWTATQVMRVLERIDGPFATAA
jgi:DNA invertase Pin-like site-specific DNA recombinase